MKALSHPLRQRILQALNQRVASPAELSQELGESLGNVSYHVKILNELEAIELVRTAPVRGALEHFYRPLVRSYIDEAHWAQLPASIRRELFNQTLQQIWDHLRDAAEEDKLDGDKESMAWIDLELDEQGADELNAALDDLLDKAHGDPERRAWAASPTSQTTNAPSRPIAPSSLCCTFTAPPRLASPRASRAEKALEVLTTRPKAPLGPNAYDYLSSGLTTSLTLSAASPTASLTLPVAWSTLPSFLRLSSSVRSPAASFTRPFASSRFSGISFLS